MCLIDNTIFPDTVKKQWKEITELQSQIANIANNAFTEIRDFADAEGIKIGLRLYVNHDITEKEIVGIAYTGKTDTPFPKVEVELAPIKADNTPSMQNRGFLNLDTIVKLWRLQRDDKQAYKEACERRAQHATDKMNTMSDKEIFG